MFGKDWNSKWKFNVLLEQFFGDILFAPKNIEEMLNVIVIN